MRKGCKRIKKGAWGVNIGLSVTKRKGNTIAFNGGGGGGGDMVFVPNIQASGMPGIVLKTHPFTPKIFFQKYPTMHSFYLFVPFAFFCSLKGLSSEI
jgi:hypothetical protein